MRLAMDFRSIMTAGAVLVSVVTMGAFLTCLALAYHHGDQNSISLLVGAVIANATTTVGFWLGSSAGSQKKDEATQAPKP